MIGLTWLKQGDAITQISAIVLLLMSVASWVIIVWKAWLLRSARADVPRCTAAVWQAPSLAVAATQLHTLDTQSLVRPLVLAATELATLPASTLGGQGHVGLQATRLLRQALHGVLGKLQFGQVLLATVGSTAPFVGLLGTVWGIYHALTAMAGAGQITIERVAGPVGEALIMTAAGLTVAIPAVLAYNLFGRWVSALEADLEGLAHDLREFVAGPSGPMGD